MPTPSLTRDSIAAAALALADREGIDSLTMRRLAAELGIGAMTIYGYFQSKDDLLDAALDLAVSERVRRETGTDWKSDLRSLFRTTYANLQRHPSLVELRLRRPLLTSRQLRLNEAGLRILEDGGFPPEQAARAFRTLFFYLFGFAALSADSEEARQEMRRAVASLPPDGHPRLTSAIEQVVAVTGGQAQFDHGLDLILDGIGSRLARGAGRSERSSSARAR